MVSSPKGYLLSQSKYARGILHHAKLNDYKVVDTPIELHANFSTSNGVPVNDPTFCQELVGCLVYLIVTHSDITYVVHVISWSVSTPRSTHWVALLRILCYVQGTIFQNVLMSFVSSLTFRVYLNANWVDDIYDCKRTSSFLWLFRTPLTLGKVKNNVIGRSTVEVEYHAITHSTIEIVGLL